jgi:crossover junction endodeoxyribonuclease RuvC
LKKKEKENNRGKIMVYIGIDPGLNGAVGIIGPDFKIVYDTPTALIAGEKIKREHLRNAMALLLEPYAYRLDVYAILEHVHAMPKQGVSSSFRFGEGKGIWEGILAAFKIPMELVSPQRWKKEMMADQGKEKKAARLKAMSLFPDMPDAFTRVKDDGRAEAMLMAEYGRRLRK